MPVTEGLMELGEWSLTLSPQTPKSVRDAISTPFAHLVVTPARLNPALVGDAAMLAAARYVGVALRPGPQYELGGAGLAWWMGDADRNGPITTSGANPGGTFQFVVGEYLNLARPGGPPITAGAVQALGGLYQQYVIHTTTREQIDAICSAYGAEWRVNTNFSLDAGTAANLYGTTPVAVLVKRAGGSEIALPGFDGTMAATSDFAEYASRIILLTGSGYGAAQATTAISTGWRNPQGNLFTRSRIYDGSDLPEDQWQSTADALLAVHEVVAGRREVTLDSSSYNVRGTLGAGSLVDVYDLDVGLFDLTNEVRYGGSVIWPQKVRVTRMTWPVEAGMGVYYRTATGVGAFAYTDLSDYVEFESPGTSIEIVAGSDAGTSSASRPSPTAQARAMEEPWLSYTPIWTSSGTAPALGNGSTVGAYRAVGTTVSVRGNLTIGSTSTVGTGDARVSLPTGLTGVAAQIQAGSAWWYVGSAVYSATAIIEGSTGYANFVVAGRAELRLPSSAFASGHSLSWGFTIERMA